MSDTKNIEFLENPKLTEFRKYFDTFEKKNQNRALAQFNSRYNGPESMSARRTLFLVLYMGLDPRSVAALELLSLLSSESGLPDLKSVGEAGLRGVSTAYISKALDERISVIRTKIDALDSDPGLAPRTDEISTVLARLQALKMKAGQSNSAARRT